jgi:hypothetical protein
MSNYNESSLGLVAVTLEGQNKQTGEAVTASQIHFP